MTWELVASCYFAYLALVAALRPMRPGARPRALSTSLALAAMLLFLDASGGLTAWVGRTAAWVLPGAVLLAGYWTSGLFFSAPMVRVEQWLLAIDRRWLAGTGVLAAYDAAPRFVRAYLEGSYLLTYAVAPAGALTLALAVPDALLNRFWIAVLAAGLGSYAVLPWLQTRPPRALEPTPDVPGVIPPIKPGAMRRLNLLVLDRASIGVNTIPSGHAAVALATAITVLDALPAAGLVFLALALSIALATIAGRYHYAIDTLLGAAAAVAAALLAARFA